MVKRLLLALLAFLPALAAPDTTTISGTVYFPDGVTVATGGTITAALSTSGTVGLDVVGGRTTAAIAADGTVSIALVPNDIIMPANTYYTVTFAVRTPTPTNWTEKWSVVSAPDPTTLGAVTRINSPAGIAGPISTVQDEGTDLPKRTKLNFTGAGVVCTDNPSSSRIDCGISGSGGGGTPGGSPSQLQFNSTGSFGGVTGTAIGTNGALSHTNGNFFDCFSASSTADCGVTSASGIRGIVFSKQTTQNGATGMAWTRGTPSSSTEYWSQGEDAAPANPTTGQVPSYFAELWGKYASYGYNGGALQSGDIMSTSYAGQDPEQLDGPAFTFNLGGFPPMTSGTNCSGAGTPYACCTGSGTGNCQPFQFYDYQFGMQSKRTDNTGYMGRGRRTAWFKPFTSQTGGVISGGVDISVNGNDDALRLMPIGISSSTRSSIFFGSASASDNWRMGHDIGNIDTDAAHHNFGLYDYAQSRYAWYIDQSGNMSVGKNSPTAAFDVNGRVKGSDAVFETDQNNRTAVYSINQGSGTNQRAAVAVQSLGSGDGYLEAYGPTYNSTDPIYAGQVMLYSTNNADLLLGASGARGIRIMHSTQRVGVNTDSPGYNFDVNGTGNFSGVLTAPTAAAGTNTTQVATTAFAQTGFFSIDGTAQTQTASKVLSEGSGIKLTINKTANSGSTDRVLSVQNAAVERIYLGQGGVGARRLLGALASDGTTERTYIDGNGILNGYDGSATGVVTTVGSSPTLTGTWTFSNPILGDAVYGPEGAIEHASKYADPNYYLLPAVVDIWQDIFLGQGTRQSAAAYSDNTVHQTLQCGTCTGLTSSICISDFTTASNTDPLAVGDVFYIDNIGNVGTTPGNLPTATTARTHVIGAGRNPGVSGSNAPTGGACGSSGHLYTVYPMIDFSSERHTNGDPISSVWRHEYHPTNGAAYLIGYKLGSNSRDLWGDHGTNLLKNGGFSGSTSGTVDGWATSYGSFTQGAFDNGSGATPPAVGGGCPSGDGYFTRDCVTITSPDGTNGTDVVQTGSIQVRPGEQYVISGLHVEQYNCDYYGFADDRDGDGVWSVASDMKVTITDTFAKTTTYVVPRWVSAVVTVPEGVHAVKFWYHSCNTSSGDLIDYFSVRKQTALGDSNVTTNYLMNDPGARNIVLMGDSWMDGVNDYGSYIKQGIIDAFAARSITVPSGQVILSGHGGDTTASILAALPGVLSTNHPLYIVLDGGINDATTGVALATTMENLKSIARLSMQAGAIPIFLSMPPIDQIDGSPRWGTGSVFELAHKIREGFRNWTMGLNVGAPPSAAPQAEYANACPVVASAATVSAPDCKYLVLSGSTNVTTLNTCDAGSRGREIRILCASYTGTITDGNNLKLAGNLTCTADDVLSLLCDGTNWLEISRSIN